MAELENREGPAKRKARLVVDDEQQQIAAFCNNLVTSPIKLIKKPSFIYLW